MRKVTARLHLMINGIAGSPEKWNPKHFTEDMREEMRAGISQADAVLPGRRAYQFFSSYWPGKAGSVPMADFMND